MSENYKIQVSFKFGLGQTGMLNIRADSVTELSNQLDEIGAADLLATVTGTNDTIKALDNVSQGGLAPTLVATPQAAATGATVTPLQQYQQQAANPAPAAPAAAPVATDSVPLPQCVHGQKSVISKMKDANTRWYAYACAAGQSDPTKCGLDFPGFNGKDMPEQHKAQAKYL